MNAVVPTLCLKNVSRSFGNFQAVKNVTEEFNSDQLNCIIGPNGAGKSTLLNMICGTLSLSQGSISFGTQQIDGLSGDKIARLGIARKFQVPSVFPSLTVWENLQISAPRDAADEFISNILTTTNLVAEKKTKASKLPHGKIQWLEIGMALAMRPKVLLLDEPTAGLSAEETKATAKFLRSLAGKVTVIVIEHDMAFVKNLKAHTLVLHQGEVIATGTFSQLEKNELVRDVYLGRR